MKVFWSWQSDTPGGIGRHLVRAALNEAIAELKIAEDIEEAVRDQLHLDSDRQGVPGSPDLARLILTKISESSVFVADVTSVGSVFPTTTEDNPKKLINSNVAIELGYALNTLGSQGVLMVMNEFYGQRHELPFDLRAKAGPILFNLCPDANPDLRRKEKSKLKASLRAALELCIQEEVKMLEAAKRIKDESLAVAVTAQDWEKLGSRFAESCQFLRADFQQEIGQPFRFWRIAGGANAMCEALLKKAGAMLLKSPKVFANLPKEIQIEPEGMSRWLSFLKWKGYAKFGETYINVDDLGNQTYGGHSGSIPDLAFSSSVVCEECAAVEL